MSLRINNPLFFRPSLGSTIIRSARVLKLRGSILLGISAALWASGTLLDMAGHHLPEAARGFSVLPVGAFAGTMMALLVMSVLRGTPEPSLRELARQSARTLTRAFDALIGLWVPVAFGICFFLLPGLFLLSALCLAFWVAIFERPDDTRACLQRSRELTIGYRWALCGLIVLNGLLCVAAWKGVEMLIFRGLDPELAAMVGPWLPGLASTLVLTWLVTSLTVFYHDLRVARIDPGVSTSPGLQPTSEAMAWGG